MWYCEHKDERWDNYTKTIGNFLSVWQIYILSMGSKRKQKLNDQTKTLIVPDKIESRPSKWVTEYFPLHYQNTQCGEGVSNHVVLHTSSYNKVIKIEITN